MEKHSSNIKEITGGNVFCGPAVLSAITGIPTNEIAELINEVRHVPYYREVKGAFIEEILATLDKIGGYKATRIDFLSNSSLYFILATVRADGFYILTLPHHFVLAEKVGSERYICDNGLKTPMRAEGSARLNQKVLQCYHIEKVGEHTYKKYNPPPPPIFTPKPKPEGPTRLELAEELIKEYLNYHDSLDSQAWCECLICLKGLG